MREIKRHWIPAFAGMTHVERFCEAPLGSKPWGMRGILPYEDCRPSGASCFPLVLMADPALGGAQVEYPHEPVVAGGKVAIEELA